MPPKSRTNSSTLNERLQKYFENVDARALRRLDSHRFYEALFRAYRKDFSLLCRLIREGHVDQGNCEELSEFIERRLGPKKRGRPAGIPHEIRLLEKSIVSWTRLIEESWRKRTNSKHLRQNARQDALNEAIEIHTHTDPDGFPVLNFEVDIERISRQRIMDELRRGPANPRSKS